MAADPDFDGIYRDFGDDDGALIAPRTAYWLWVAAGISADEWSTKGDDADMVGDYLPRATWAYAEGEWLRAFAACFGVWEQRLTRGEVGAGTATCTAEEMALQLIIDYAKDLIADADPKSRTRRAADKLVPGGESDDDLEAARDDLLEDSDVLMLFDAAFDGVESGDDPALESLGIAKLHPRDWFTPFRSGDD